MLVYVKIVLPITSDMAITGGMDKIVMVKVSAMHCIYYELKFRGRNL